MKSIHVVTAGLLLTLGQTMAALPEAYRFADIVHMSCNEAWVAAGEKDENAIAMIIVLADHSLAARKMSFPDTQQAGDDLGDYIVAECNKHPENLLYNEVDKGLRKVVNGRP